MPVVWYHVPSTIRSVQGLSAATSTPSSSRCPRACNVRPPFSQFTQFPAIAGHSILLVQKKPVPFST